MKLKLLALLFSLTLILLFSNSCQKETDCLAVVKCLDASGNAVNAAEVVLYAEVKNSAGVTYTADITATKFVLPLNYQPFTTFSLPKRLEQKPLQALVSLSWKKVKP
jgi:hypothetical protein